LNADPVPEAAVKARKLSERYQPTVAEAPEAANIPAAKTASASFLIFFPLFGIVSPDLNFLMLPSGCSFASISCAISLLSLRLTAAAGTSKRTSHRSELYDPQKQRHRHTTYSGSIGNADPPPAHFRRSLTIHVYRKPVQAAIPEDHGAPASGPKRDIFATLSGAGHTDKPCPPPSVSARLAITAATPRNPRNSAGNLAKGE
jgi:hypothetical protein